MSRLSRLLGRSRRLPEDQTVAILHRHLNRDFIVYPMAERPSSEEFVRILAEQMGIPFPAEVIAHLTGEFPGILIEAKEEVWPRHKAFDVGPFWSFLHGFHTFTASMKSEDWMRMDCAAKKLQEETGKKVAPILKIIGDASVYCVDDQSALVRYDHELGEFEPVELGFFELFEQEVRELRERTEMKKGGRQPGLV